MGQNLVLHSASFGDGDYLKITRDFCFLLGTNSWALIYESHVLPLNYTPAHQFNFDSTGVWTEDIVFARQALYHLSYALALFALVIFQIKSSTLC
jgi:hypothetical protein